MSLDHWPGAFLLTQAVEVPLYLLAARALRPAICATYAVGASTLTHPVIWFCLPWQTGPYVVLAFVAEIFAVTVEALWGRLWQVPHCWRAALVANASSVLLGLALRTAWS